MPRVEVILRRTDESDDDELTSIYKEFEFDWVPRVGDHINLDFGGDLEVHRVVLYPAHPDSQGDKRPLTAVECNVPRHLLKGFPEVQPEWGSVFR